MSQTLSEIFGEPIHVYTRRQAIEDGVLIDVTATAREAGFVFPVALTAAAWEDSVAWDNQAEQTHQDEAGRLWDVLYMAAYAIRRNRVSADELKFSFYRIPHGRRRALLNTLKLHVGPGDQGEPVVTIMMTNED